MYKALIIDDEKPVRIAISKLGHWSQYGIETPALAANGKDGLQTMRELHPDLVFVDMNMPVMTGTSFLEQAHQEFPDSQYIVVSGYDDFSYAQHALRFGACDYLLKPVVEEDLNKSIEKALLLLDPSINFEELSSNHPEEVSPEEVVDIIRQYIDSNYCQNFKITMFEEKYFFSITYLTKLFRAKYGCTIYEYIVKLRMERAKELLKEPDHKVQEISDRLGYTDHHYFSKAFRNYYGISPSAYRKELGLQ